MRIQEFDFSVDLLQVILWQYNRATNLTGILQGKQSWYDLNQTEFWQNWYDDVFNLQTANLFGLTIWSIILNIPLFIQINPDPPGKPLWGFNEIPLINTYVNFENGNFTSRDSTIELTLEEQRIVCKLRYFQLVTRGNLSVFNTLPDPADVLGINQFLDFVFGPLGGAYLLDYLDMTIACNFLYPISTQLLVVIQQYDLIPRPAAVALSYIVPPY